MSDEGRPLRSALLETDSYSQLPTSDTSGGDQSVKNGIGAALAVIYKYFRIWPFYSSRRVRKTSRPVDRLVDRDGVFKQSNGGFAVKKKINAEIWRSFYLSDIFHSLADAPTSRIVVFVITLYVSAVCIFAEAYYIVSCLEDCNLDLHSYHDAFLFALQTMATIGYGTKDIFFGECFWPMIIITTQICSKLFIDGIIMGLIFTRISRPTKRARTLIFSSHAIIRRVNGKLYFMFQLVELRKHQLIEAQVRLYAIRRHIDPPDPKAQLTRNSGSVKTSNPTANSRNTPDPFRPLNTGTLSAHSSNKRTSSTTASTGLAPQRGPTSKGLVTHFQTVRMRLNHPNDELGGALITWLPQLIVHEIDAFSPLMPPPLWRSCTSGLSYKWCPPVFDTLEQQIHSGSPTSISISTPTTTYTSAPTDQGQEQRQGQDEDFDPEKPQVTVTETVHVGKRFSSHVILVPPDYHDEFDTHDHGHGDIHEHKHKPDGRSTSSSSGSHPQQHTQYALHAQTHTRNHGLADGRVRRFSASAVAPPVTSHSTGSLYIQPGAVAMYTPKSLPSSPERRLSASSTTSFRRGSAGQQGSGGNGGSLSAAAFAAVAATNAYASTSAASTKSDQSSTKIIEDPFKDSLLASCARFPNVVGRIEPTLIEQRDSVAQSGTVISTTLGGYSSSESLLSPASTASSARSSVSAPASKSASVSTAAASAAIAALTASSSTSQDISRVGKNINNNNNSNRSTNSSVSSNSDSSAKRNVVENDSQSQHPHSNEHHSQPQHHSQHQHQHRQSKYREEQDMVTNYMADRRMEILVLVEGVDPSTGSTVQARHSFICPEIMWHKGFAQCVFEDESDGSAVIDFSQFHSLVDVSHDSVYCGSVPSFN